MDAGVLTEAGFAATGEAEWRRLVEKALKGADFEAELVSVSDDGIAYGPIGLRDPEGVPHMRSDSTRPWTVVQRVDDPDGTRAAAQAAADLDGGANGLAICVEGATSAHGFGIPRDALKGHVESIAGAPELRFEAPTDAMASVLDLLDDRPEGIAHVDLGLVPHGAPATGGAAFDEATLLPLLERAFASGLVGTVLRADGRIAHNAGASEAQELGFAIAAAVDMLRIAEKAGIAPEAALAATEFALSADQDQFLTIAKFRALRQVHRRLQDALGVAEPAAVRIHAETSWRMLTRRDPETNILRNTIAVFSAGVGGADSISVLPHTLAHGLPDRFARRLARNTQTLLIDESHLAFVSDPAAGAGGIEALTSALAEKAWVGFQAIESEGGLARSLADGALAHRVEAVRRKRAEAVAAGRRPLVGATIYPPAVERPVEVLAGRPATSGGTGAFAPISLDMEEPRDREKGAAA